MSANQCQCNCKCECADGKACKCECADGKACNCKCECSQNKQLMIGQTIGEGSVCSGTEPNDCLAFCLPACRSEFKWVKYPI